jgi:hypothetical protein
MVTNRQNLTVLVRKYKISLEQACIDSACVKITPINCFSKIVGFQAAAVTPRTFL